MISRYFTIALAMGVCVFQLSRGAWVEATGLGALAGGLILLQLAPARPQLKPLAWGLFAVTAVAMVIVFMRTRMQ